MNVFVAVKTLDKVLVVLTVISAAVMTGLVFLSSVMRYLFGSPFSFTEEAVGLLFITTVFLALGSVAIRNSHIEIDLINSVLGKRISVFLNKISHLIVAFFFAYLTYLVWDYLVVSYDLRARTDVARILIWPWVIPMLVGSAVAFLVAACKCFPKFTAIAATKSR